MLRPLLAAAVLAGVVGCKDDEIVPATQVVVTVNSDLEIGTQLTSVEVEVLDPDDGHVVEMRSFELTPSAPRDGEVQVPFSFGLARGKKERFRLDVVGYGALGAGGAEQAVIEQKVIGSFRPRETLLLKIFLGKLCFDNLCEDELTCYPETQGDTPAGECGGALKPILETVRAGEEGDVWTSAGTGAEKTDGGLDGGPADAGTDAGPTASGGRGGAAGRSGSGGRSGGEAGSSDEAGNGAAGDEGSAGQSAGTGGASGSGGECERVERDYNTSVANADHVTTPLPASEYASNPPSFGPHCDDFGDYTVFPDEKPLPLCNFMHNLEHGAIVFLYKCTNSSCPEVLDGLKSVMRDAPADTGPNCESGQRRLILTRFTDMDATFAAVAWGHTWTSNCAVFDDDVRAALFAFIDAHRGRMGEPPEPDQCSPGIIVP